jgi:hypothetical protein
MIAAFSGESDCTQANMTTTLFEPSPWKKKGVRNRLLTFVLQFAILVGYGKSKASGSWWFDLSCA